MNPGPHPRREREEVIAKAKNEPRTFSYHFAQKRWPTGMGLTTALGTWRAFLWAGWDGSRTKEKTLCTLNRPLTSPITRAIIGYFFFPKSILARFWSSATRGRPNIEERLFRNYYPNATWGPTTKESSDLQCSQYSALVATLISQLHVHIPKNN